MASIHLIKKTGRGLPQIKLISKDPMQYESGYWTLSENTASLLIRGDIYFHEHQDSASHFGGQIIGYDCVSEGQYAGKIVFVFEPLKDNNGIRTARSGWAQEMKIIR